MPVRNRHGDCISRNSCCHSGLPVPLGKDKYPLGVCGVKLMVSACLLGENCKYNGGNNQNQKVMDLLADNEIVPICPEVLGGLPTPREPAELRQGEVVTRDGSSVDLEFRMGAQKCLQIAMREQPNMIILQSRSPSCGVKQHYDGTFSGKLTDGPGVTADLLRKSGFRVIDVEDL